MATFFKQIKDNLKGLWIYSLCFIFMFNLVFLPRLANSNETVGMFVIASFFLQLLTFIFYPLAIAGLSQIIRPINIVAKAIVLFLVFEMLLFLFNGNVSLFGLFEIPIPNVSKDLQSDLLFFHTSRDFALSMSNLISVIVYFVAVAISRKRRRQPLTQAL